MQVGLANRTSKALGIPGFSGWRLGEEERGTAASVPLTRLSRRCAGSVGPGDTRDVYARLLEDLAQGAAWLLLRGRSLLSCLRRHLLHLPRASHHQTPE